MVDDSESGDPPVFFPRNTSDHEMIPAGGPDPNTHWGRRYEPTRDHLLDGFVGDGHQPQIWRYMAHGIEGGSLRVSIVRCSRCDYRTQIHRFPVPWARYRGTACVPMTDEALRERAAHKSHREARSGWIIGAVISAGLALAVAGNVITDDNTHPMLRVLGVAAGVACLYNIGKVIRHRSK